MALSLGRIQELWMFFEHFRSGSFPVSPATRIGSRLWNSNNCSYNFFAMPRTSMENPRKSPNLRCHLDGRGMALLEIRVCPTITGINQLLCSDVCLMNFIRLTPNSIWQVVSRFRWLIWGHAIHKRHAGPTSPYEPFALPSLPFRCGFKMTITQSSASLTVFQGDVSQNSWCMHEQMSDTRSSPNQPHSHEYPPFVKHSHEHEPTCRVFSQGKPLRCTHVKELSGISIWSFDDNWW